MPVWICGAFAWGATGAHSSTPTADTGDTAHTGATGHTGLPDDTAHTGAPAEHTGPGGGSGTGGSGTGGSGGGGADSGLVVTAASLAGEEGGVGCAHAPGSLAAAFVAALAWRRR